MIEWISKNVDKVLHFFVAYSITLTGALIHIFFGVAAAVALSVAKEARDEIVYSGWSWGDLIADALGIITAIAAVILASLWK